MTSLEKKRNIIKMLAVIQEAMGRLYEAYAGSFPEHEEFWFGLAMEEVDHANWIFDLANKVIKGSASVDEDIFKTEDIQEFLYYLKEQLDRARHKKITFNEALTIALNIEKSPIEREFFNIFRGSSEEDQHILDYLTSTIDNHVEVLQQKIKQQKNS